MNLTITPHVVLALAVIALIYLTGIQNVRKYFRTRNLSLFLHAFTYFAGATTYLLALIPTLLMRPQLFAPLLSIGIVLITVGMAAYLYLIAGFQSRSLFLRFGLAFLTLLLGGGILLLFSCSPPTIQFPNPNWTSYVFSGAMKVFMIVLFALGMFAGGFVFFSQSIRQVGEAATRRKGVLLGLGYLLLAGGVFLAVLGESVFFNFLLLFGYSLIFLTTLQERKA